MGDLPSLQTGRGQEGPLLLLLNHPWVTASRTLTTTRYRMSGSVASLSIRCQTFLHLSPTCPSPRPTPARSPRLTAEALAKRREELLLFLPYPGEEEVTANATPGTTFPSCLSLSSLLCAHCAFTCGMWFHLWTATCTTDLKSGRPSKSPDSQCGVYVMCLCSSRVAAFKDQSLFKLRYTVFG